ncbi:MAG: serine/threonine protein kinase, partial [Deltaproteobacteria bacterium]|nr:serine/threonine protein kinase [Deltaproteobacteria bacterium]
MDENDATRMRRLGRYELLDSLGSGGMGDVHRARAYGAAGTVKELCIKRIRPSRLSDAGAVERFVSEARLSMRLSHNNIVPVFDFGRADGQYFLAMEWVDGSDLRSLLRAGPLPACVAAHVAAEVARALEYAHALPESQGGPLIHRDVKPGNILISSAGDVKLVDFGVAVAGPADTEGRVGTLAYMAPEQERGEAVDARADLFALGVVLAEMLGLGRLRCAQDLPEETPPAIAASLKKLLAEDRSERPAHAKAVASELEDLVARQRVAGEQAPRDSLRESVAARRVSHPDSVEPEILATDLSYLRDGEERTLGSMLCATGSTAAHGPADDEDPRAPSPSSAPEGRGRKLWLLALALGLLSGAAALRFGGARAEPSTPATTPAQGRGQHTRAISSEGDAPAPETTEALAAPSPSAA